MRYQIWDKQSDIYTPGGDKFTPSEWKAKFSWVTIPGAKMIISAGIINGEIVMEFGAAVDHYKRAGAAITDGMTDEEVLAAIEAFEDTPPADQGPTVEERTAAALEFLAMNSLPDEE